MVFLVYTCYLFDVLFNGNVVSRQVIVQLYHFDPSERFRILKGVSPINQTLLGTIH